MLNVVFFFFFSEWKQICSNSLVPLIKSNYTSRTIICFYLFLPLQMQVWQLHCVLTRPNAKLISTSSRKQFVCAEGMWYCWTTWYSPSQKRLMFKVWCYEVDFRQVGFVAARASQNQ